MKIKSDLVAEADSVNLDLGSFDSSEEVADQVEVRANDDDVGDLFQTNCGRSAVLQAFGRAHNLLPGFDLQISGLIKTRTSESFQILIRCKPFFPLGQVA